MKPTQKKTSISLFGHKNQFFQSINQPTKKWLITLTLPAPKTQNFRKWILIISPSDTPLPTTSLWRIIRMASGAIAGLSHW